MPKFRQMRPSIANLAIGCLTVLLVLNTVIAYIALKRIAADNARVQAAQQILLELHNTLTLLLDCETGQRGYLITNRAEYLEPYKRALGEIGTHLNTLEGRASRNPVLSADLPELKSLAVKKL